MDELLLDSTYLLPVFGLRVDLTDFPTLFPSLLDSYSVMYNPAALIEAKWIILKLGRKTPAKRERLLEAYRAGLRALEPEERLMQTTLTIPGVEEVADMLLGEHGVKDYFDRLTYATASQ